MIHIPLKRRRITLARRLLLAGILQLGSFAAAHAATVYVVPGGAGTMDGSSWVNAKDLRPALEAAVPGDELWVKSGTYKPAGAEGDRKATFTLKSGVALYGGFAGTETERSQRNSDPAFNGTVLSGDLNGNDSGFTNNGENSYHVIIGSGTDETAILDGFTISGGNADGILAFGSDSGGGLLIYNGSPTLINLIFWSNSGYAGGGIYNSTQSSGGSGVASSPTLINVTFSGNSATSGGGIYNSSQSLDGGGAVSRPTLTNVTFSGNSATSGGGIYNSSQTLGGGGAVNRPTLTNVIFSGNSATSGGGIYNSSQSSGGGGATSSPTLTNVTLSGNSATSGGGIYNSSHTSGGGGASSSPVVRNCILWGNGGSEIGGETATASNSIVEGGYPGGTNILDADPMFVAPIAAAAPTTTGNLRLQASSPAIDAGDNAAALPTTDLDGRARIVGANVDLGAYEFFGEKVAKPAAPAAPAKLTLSGTGGFGRVEVGRTSRVRRITVRNVGDEEASGLTVFLAPRWSREFLIGSLATTVLEPGGSAPFRARFRPSGEGRRSAVVEVRATGVSPVSMRLAGQGISELPMPEGYNVPRAPIRIVP